MVERKHQPPTFFSLALCEAWSWSLIFFIVGWILLLDFSEHILTMLFSLMLIGLGGYRIVTIITRIKKKAELYRIGKTTVATITGFRDVSFGLNALPAMRIRYKFTAEGEEYYGESKSLPVTETAIFEKGSNIEILYNPDIPEYNFWCDEDRVQQVSFSWRALGR